MKIVKKFGKKILFVAVITLLLIFVETTGFPDIFFINGESKSYVTAYLTSRFSTYTKTKGLKVSIFVPQSIPEGLITQTIYGVRKTFTPYPTDIKVEKDKYGNSIIHCYWNKEIRIVQIDLQFRAKIQSQFTSVDTNAPYPIETDATENIYLEPTPLTPANEYLINYVSRALAYNLNREMDVVYNIALWINNNILLTSFSNKDEKNDALSVLKNRKGTEEGICNLMVSMLKGIGIPARVAYGVSFEKEISFKSDTDRIILDFPNNERYWVEVYFPDAGWLSFDPHGYYLSLPSHIVKMGVGPDSDYVKERWSVETGKLVELKEFIYDIKSNISKLSYNNQKIDTDKVLAVSCSVPNFVQNNNQPDMSIEGLKHEKKEQNNKKNSPKTNIVKVSENPYIKNRIDLVATGKKIYAQAFKIEKPVRITEIRIPAIKFSDSGKIYVEVREDKNNNPGKRIFRSYNISSERVRYMMVDNPWLSFPISKKVNSTLKPGKYWLALRSTGNCIFNWFSVEGNQIGNWDDTRYLNLAYKNPKWNNILNLDFNFQVLGKEVKQKK